MIKKSLVKMFEYFMTLSRVYKVYIVLSFNILFGQFASNVVNVDTKPAEGNTSAEEKQDRVSDEVKESDADEGQEHVGKEEGGDAETVELVQKIFDAINPNHNGKLAKTEFKKAIFTNPDVGMLLSADETLSILKHPMHLEEPFQSLDTDHDGFVSSDELLAFATTLNNANNDKTAQIKFLESMGKQAWRMSRLVEDLLTLSKIESDDKELHFESINVADLVQGVVDNLYNKADKKNIKIRIIKNTDKLNVKADYDAMMQVFINLLDNAINYSKENSNITINFDEE